MTLLLSGNKLISAAMDGSVRVFDAQTQALRFAMAGSRGGVTSAAPSHTGEKLFVGAADGLIRCYSLADGSLLAELHGHAAPVVALAPARSGDALFSAAADGRVLAHSTAPGLLLHSVVASFDGHTAHVCALLLSRDGAMLVTASRDGSLRQWRVGDAACVRVLHSGSPGGAACCAALSADGQRLWSGHADGSLRLWRLADGGCAAQARPHSEEVGHIALSRGEEAVATASVDGTAALSAADSLTCLLVAGPTPTCDPFLSMALPKDGRELWTGGQDGTLRKWLLAPAAPFSRGPCLNLGASKPRQPSCLPANLTGVLAAAVAAAADICARDRLSAAIHSARAVQQAAPLLGLPTLAPPSQPEEELTALPLSSGGGAGQLNEQSGLRR